MKIQIFAMTHKTFDTPPDPLYVSLQVGHATHEDLGYLADDTGDNISAKNCYYSELTGLYWVWKNVKDLDYVGVCHYRRYLLNDAGSIFTRAQLAPLLKDYDMITSKCLTLNFSYAYGFGENHTPEDLAAAGQVIAKLYPDFYPLYAKRLQENHTYFGNMMICSKPLFDEYCAFLFPIFEAMHPLLALDTYDDYHKRLYGFISEFLLMVWCEYRHLRVKECKVGLIGEKKETKETVQKLFTYFRKEDIAGAKAYFLSVKEKRPDILMEASDIDGRLHLCLQIISTCEFELASCQKIQLDLHQPEDALLTAFTKLNHISTELSFSKGQFPTMTKTDRDFLKTFSPDAIAISLRLYCPDDAHRKNCCKYLSQKLDCTIPCL